jgi:hypothetical protein
MLGLGKGRMRQGNVWRLHHEQTLFFLVRPNTCFMYGVPQSEECWRLVVLPTTVQKSLPWVFKIMILPTSPVNPGLSVGMNQISEEIYTFKWLFVIEYSMEYHYFQLCCCHNSCRGRFCFLVLNSICMCSGARKTGSRHHSEIQLRVWDVTSLPGTL